MAAPLFVNEASCINEILQVLKVSVSDGLYQYQVFYVIKSHLMAIGFTNKILSF